MTRSSGERPFGQAVEVLFQVFIFYSLATYFVELEFVGSESSVSGPKFFLWSERIVAGVFTVEYVLRWVLSRRWSYPLTFAALIDLLAVLPFYIGFLVDLRALRLVRTLRMLRLFKLHRYNAALRNFVASIRSVADQLSALGIVILFFVMLSSSLLYEFEHSAQPQIFARLSDGLWWCVTTLTTVGYGDKYPITTAGRITATFTVVFGLGVFGTFISVIGGAFLQTRGVAKSIRISPAMPCALGEACYGPRYRSQ
jgi:voltage-gated potassium channel